MHIQLLLLTILASLTLVQCQDVCTVDRVTLSTLSATSYVVSNQAYTVGFCKAVQPTAGSLAACPTAGYVSTHDVGTGTCQGSYDTIASGLTATSTGVYYVVSQSTNPNNRANVSVECRRSGANTEASLIQPIVSSTDGSTTTITLRFLSYAGCSVDNFFCSNTVACADASKSCLNGVCVSKTCTKLESQFQESKAPANFVSKFTANDCDESPLVNLTASDFVVTLNGISITDRSIADETTSIVRSTEDSPIPQLTTLVLDQSRSVQESQQDTLIAAAKAFVETAMQSTHHYVALIGFDGGPKATVLLPHSNDRATVVNAIEELSQKKSLGDPDATNLYGAVISGLRESYQMKFSFGNISSKVISSMIFFTDGYDTAGRAQRQDAINVALGMASSIKVISIGIANISDAGFLSSIATSGSYTSVSLSSLVQTFTDIANQLNLLSSNSYYVLLCIPMRSSNVAVSISLNSTEFPGGNTLSYNVPASNFTSGCTAEQLLSEVKEAASPAAFVHELSLGQTLDYQLLPHAAYFVNSKFDGKYPVRVFVEPVTTVYYLAGNRCLLSHYCYDGTFNTSFVVGDDQSYSFMLVSSSENTYAVSLRSELTTTPSPQEPSPDGPQAPTTPAPTVNTSTLSDDVSGGDIDDEATIIFAVFGLIFFAVIIAFLFRTSCLQHVSETEGSHAQYHSPSRGGGSLSRPLMPSPHPTHSSLVPPTLLQGMSPPRKTVEVHSVFSADNPYRTSGFFSDQNSALSPSMDRRFTPSKSFATDNL